jgi:hypothetical protein
MLITEFRIKIIGHLKKEELILPDPHLDAIAKAIEKKTSCAENHRLHHPRRIPPEPRLAVNVVTKDDRVLCERCLDRSHVEEPKRPKSKASIPIVAQLKTLLDRHRAKCGNPTRGFVFANAKGNAMNLEALARDVIRPAIKEAGPKWHGWHAFRRGLATNLHRLGISDKVIQQILRHANVTTTMNIYVKTVSSDATAAMKTLETMCATTVQPLPLASTRVM